VPIPRAGETATVLFGSTPDDVFDAISERIDDALRDGVASLPFLPPTGGEPSEGGGRRLSRLSLGGGGGDAIIPPDEKLLRILRDSYAANLALADQYARRNIFALPHGTGPVRRREVVEAYLFGPPGEGPNPNGAPVEAAETAGPSSVEESLKSQAPIPYLVPAGPDDVPTPEQLEAVEAEMAELRGRLRAARRLRSDLRSVAAGLEGTKAAADAARTALSEAGLGGGDGDGERDGDGDGDGSSLKASVASAAAGGEEMRALNETGRDLIRRLDEEKEARTVAGKEDGEDGVIDLAGVAAAAAAAAGSKKPLSIEEDMDKRRKVMRTGEKEELAKVSALLKEG
jgi:hypothetical protein